jgi:hypothetical protein
VCFFGSKVWDAHLKAKGFVNSHLNPHWKKSILDKSGNSTSAVFLGIRQYLWQSGLEKKCKEKVDNALKYARMKGNTEALPENASDKAEMVALEVSKLEEKGFDEKYYPKEWLCFVLFGKPAGDDKLDSYASGLGGVSEKKRMFTLADIQEEGTNIRKQARNKANSSANSTTHSADSDTNKQTRTVKVEFTRASSKTSEGNERINLIEKRISCLEKLVSRRINPEENERKITECYQQMDELLEEMTRRHQESVSSLANVFETPSEEV